MINSTCADDVRLVRVSAASAVCVCVCIGFMRNRRVCELMESVICVGVIEREASLCSFTRCSTSASTQELEPLMTAIQDNTVCTCVNKSVKLAQITSALSL